MNVDKTKLTLFRSKRKQIIKYLNFRISGQKINTPNKVKYLGMQMEQHLDWNVHIKNIVPKLNRPIGILSKIRHHVRKFLLKTIYYSIFNSHLIYACYLFNTHLISKLQCNIFFQPLGRGRGVLFSTEMCPRWVVRNVPETGGDSTKMWNFLPTLHNGITWDPSPSPWFP